MDTSMLFVSWLFRIVSLLPCCSQHSSFFILVLLSLAEGAMAPFLSPFLPNLLRPNLLRP